MIMNVFRLYLEVSLLSVNFYDMIIHSFYNFSQTSTWRVWGVVTAKIKFRIFIMLFSDVLFNILSGVFDVRQNVAVVVLFLYSIISNVDAIIRVCMLLWKTSMLLFVSIYCYAKAWCYYSCLYAVMPNVDAIFRVSNYVHLNLGLQRARLLWSGASDKLIMPILPTFWYFQCQRLQGNCLGTFRATYLPKLGF